MRKKFSCNGSEFEVKFGWRQIAECRRELKQPTLKGLDISKLMNSKEKDENGQVDIAVEEAESIMDFNFDTIDSMVRICQIGMMASGVTEEQSSEYLDLDPNLIREIFSFFQERNQLYQIQVDFNPQEDDKELGEKKSRSI